jgi:hypothetical protein
LHDVFGLCPEIPDNIHGCVDGGLNGNGVHVYFVCKDMNL